jgi:hypothetical protein
VVGASPQAQVLAQTLKNRLGDAIDIRTVATGARLRPAARALLGITAAFAITLLTTLVAGPVYHAIPSHLLPIGGLALAYTTAIVLIGVAAVVERRRTSTGGTGERPGRRSEPAGRARGVGGARGVGRVDRHLTHLLLARNFSLTFLHCYAHHNATVDRLPPHHHSRHRGPPPDGGQPCCSERSWPP